MLLVMIITIQRWRWLPTLRRERRVAAFCLITAVPAMLQRAVVVRSPSRSVPRRTFPVDRKMPGDRIWAQRSGLLVYRDARPANACACERLADARKKAAAKPCYEEIDFFQIRYIVIFNSALTCSVRHGCTVDLGADVPAFAMTRFDQHGFVGG
jgi:hypothetical protein